MNWKCEHCGFEAESETSCCFEHWEQKADERYYGGLHVVLWFLVAFIVIVSIAVGVRA